MKDEVWMGLMLDAAMMQAYFLMPQDVRDQLEAWEDENLDGYSISTDDWPDWFVWLNPAFHKTLSDRISRGKATQPTKQSRPIAPAKRWQVWERDNFTCRQCGSRSRLSIDHVVPVSKDGTDDLDNLQTLCKSCNSRKGTRQP